MKNNFLAFILILLSPPGIAQEVSKPKPIEEHIGAILRNKGEEADNQSYFELLMQYYNNPININTANYDELSALRLLSNTQINDLIAYRSKFGDFENKYQLMSIASLTLEEIRTLLPFISFNQPIRLGKLLKNSFAPKNNLILVSASRAIELPKSFTNGVFLGDPFQYNLRIKFTNPGYTSAGITLQKDPGELLFRTDSLYTGPDFYSFHYYIQNQGRLKQLALGDYKLQFGQGLLLGAGFLVGKNASTISSIQPTLKIQPYTSLTEFRFFRGLGATIALWPKWEISVFYSSKNNDATSIITDSISGVTSIRTSGLHRTLSEWAAQNTLHTQVAGGSITYASSWGEVGILGLYNKFGSPINPKITLENYYKFRGTENINFSAFGRYNYRNISFYGELAHTLYHGSAINIGAIASLSKAFDFSFQYRYLDPDFHSFYGVSFAESSTITNERGAYWGMNFKLNKALSVIGYIDMYKFPWLTSSLPKPAYGNDGLLRITYKVKKAALFYTQVQSELKERRISGSTVKETQPHKLVKYVFNMDYNLESNISFRSRIQWTKSFFQTNEVGILLYQDINLNVRKFTVSGRYALFDTDGYLSRQYMYEKGILYSFNTPQFSGKGIRYYFVGKFSPSKNLAIRGKWSQTVYFDRTAISSGLTEIPGNKQSQITIQLKYDF